MEWLRSKTTLVVGGFLALIGLQGYGMMSMRSSIDERVSTMERELQTLRETDSAKLTKLAADLDVISKTMGGELDEATAVTQKLKQENAQTLQRLRRELAEKADSKAVVRYHEDATNKLNAVQQEATTKIDGVTGEVRTVRTDLDTTRTDLNTTREDLANSKRDLGTLIARNSTELNELRRRGERDYVEFDLRKSKTFQRVGDVMVQLKNTNVKQQKYEVVINADDSAIQKKDRTANEPVTFLVGRDRLRYEFVVNYVDKDRIRGYLSTPKDKLVAAESPAIRRVP